MTKQIQATVISGSLGTTFSDSIGASISGAALSVFNSSKYAVFPGFCDVHLHC